MRVNQEPKSEKLLLLNSRRSIFLYFFICLNVNPIELNINVSQRSDVKFYTSSKPTGTILHSTYQCRAYFTSVHVAQTKMD